jgi:hypothetical protein
MLHLTRLTGIEHLTYSPDLVSNEFFLFPKTKSALKGQRFQDTENIIIIKKVITATRAS